MGRVGFIDGFVIAAFFAVMVAVGVYYGRRERSVSGFFGGDKSLPWWLLGVSFYMNSFSALAFVMYSALGYKFGFVPITISWVSVPAVLLGLWILAFRWRRTGEGSPIAYVTRRFGPRTTAAMMWLGLPMQVLDSAFKLLAIGTVVGVIAKSALPPDFPLETVLGWSIALSGALIIFYTFLGGLKATLVCDFIQFLVILVVVVVLPIACLLELGCGKGLLAGWTRFWHETPPEFFRPVAGQYGWNYMVFYLLLMFLQLGTTWSLIQRYQSTKSEREVSKTGWCVATLLFVGPPLFFFPAMATRLLIPGLDVEDPTTMNGVYALICLKVLPTGMVGLVLAAMFSATMSTLAGTYNAVSNVFTEKFRGGLPMARVLTVLTGLLVILITFLMRTVQGANDLFDVLNQVLSLFIPPLAVAMIAGVLCRWLTRRSGLAGLLTGVGSGLCAFIAGIWIPVLRDSIPMFWLTSIMTLLGMIVASMVWKDSPSVRAETEVFFRQLENSEK